MNFVNWIVSHWSDVLAIIGGVVSVASVIVKLTPTTKDDSVLNAIIKVLAAVSIVNPDGSLIGSKEEK